MLKKIDPKDYNYHLPDEKIAKYPLSERDKSKLLVYRDGEIIDDTFTSLHSYLPVDSKIIFNNTKVIQARINFRKATGASIEIFCLEPYNPSEYSHNLASTNMVEWKCMVGNSKKWKTGKLTETCMTNGGNLTLHAEISGKDDDYHLIIFTWDNPSVTFAEILEFFGNTPIPPYLNRQTEFSDRERYQTIYSKYYGSVAAPTAGLHFTKEVFSSLNQKNILAGEITLHVGAGTFKPIKVNDATHHIMHTEHFEISKEFLLFIKGHNDLTAVGTTTTRALESLPIIVYKLRNNLENPFHISQWEAYNENIDVSLDEVTDELIHYLETRKMQKLLATTQIMIVPGFNFRIVNKLITNFHQPKSTLLLLISAFCDENWKSIYSHAIENDYRFLSYGDSSLLIRGCESGA